MHSFTLRDETQEDEPFLRRLFYAIRSKDFLPMGLAPQQLEMMLGMQFMGQRNQYQSTFPDGDRKIVEVAGEPVGRIYVAPWDDTLHLVDIALLPEWSGRGIGGALLDGLVARAQAERIAVGLSVRPENPARQLYARKGFVEQGWIGADIAMMLPA